MGISPGPSVQTVSSAGNKLTENKPPWIGVHGG